VGTDLLTVILVGVIILLIPGLIWLVRAAKNRPLKRRAGTYAVMYSLFFSFGRMFEGTPDFVQVAIDPERKKRVENGDPPSPPAERD